MTTFAPQSPAENLVLPAWLAATAASEIVLDRLIYQAYTFARDHHTGQMRKSGEPYICHPIAVADILYNLGGEPPMIAAGFLHDIVEDVEEITIADIEKLFGAETAHLVEGVTKLSKLNFRSKKEQQAENFRRMFLAMAQDIRVIVVKLADRLHNMQTLEHMPPEKQTLIAQETRDIFAPLANRLGLGRIKWELEDLAFKYIEPEEYRRIQDLVKETRKAREGRITSTVEQIRSRLADTGLKYFDVSGRPKHLYSIYQKMSRQKKEFSEIYDLTALRVIVQNNADCYRVLAEVHDAFRPIPGRFKDYIGLPKPNRYQSLHTTVLGIANTPLEIQIRTTEMHRVAEYGIAAHWKYKEAAVKDEAPPAKKDDKFIWLRQLLEWQSDFKDAQEFSDNLKDQLIDPDVYVFTPNGEVVALRERATTIDFAYRIHTEVGNHCVGAKINGRIVPLSTQVRNGDIVEILTKESGHPSLDWLSFVATPTAKNRITQWYKRSNRDENIARGRELLEKELGKSGLDALLKSEPMVAVAQKCNYQTVEDLLAALGYGEITNKHVVNRIQDTVKTSVAVAELEMLLPNKKPTTTDGDFPIIGIEGLMHHLAGCCNPIPEEPIVGVVTKINGISIHRQGCGNVENVDGNRILPVRWNPNYNSKQNNNRRSYIVTLQVEVFDRVGVMRDVLSRLSDNKVNVRQAKVTADNKSKPAMLDLCVEVVDKSQLDRCINQIRQMHDVLHVRRMAEMEKDN